MKIIRSSLVGIVLCTGCLFAQQQADAAEDVGALRQHVKDLEERLVSLEGQVRMLKSTVATPPSARPPSTPVASEGQAPNEAVPPAGVSTGEGAAGGIGQTPTYGGAGGSAAKALNPDISVIGDFVRYRNNSDKHQLEDPLGPDLIPAFVRWYSRYVVSSRRFLEDPTAPDFAPTACIRRLLRATGRLWVARWK